MLETSGLHNTYSPTRPPNTPSGTGDVWYDHSLIKAPDTVNSGRRAKQTTLQIEHTGTDISVHYLQQWCEVEEGP